MNLDKFYSQDNDGFSVIDINVENLNELFHYLDHSVLHKKDLDPNVEQYIFESVEELKDSKKKIVIFCQNGCEEQEQIEKAEIGVKLYFHYRYNFYYGHLKSKLYQGISSIILGTIFLFLYVIVGEHSDIVKTNDLFKGVIEEGLLIMGWVALWKPIEILLYDWRVEFNKFKIYKEIIKIDISIKNFNSHGKIV